MDCNLVGSRLWKSSVNLRVRIIEIGKPGYTFRIISLISRMTWAFAGKRVTLRVERLRMANSCLWMDSSAIVWEIVEALGFALFVMKFKRLMRLIDFYSNRWISLCVLLRCKF